MTGVGGEGGLDFDLDDFLDLDAKSLEKLLDFFNALPVAPALSREWSSCGESSVSVDAMLPHKT